MAGNTTYCDFKTLMNSYQKFHGPLSLFVCCFGSVANILNICVLTTKEMRGPTNLILTGLAVADLLVMIDYIPFSYFRFLKEIVFAHEKSYELAFFYKCHAIVSQVFHFSACCLTVLLAIWRYLVITNPSSGKFWCECRKTVIAIIVTYLICSVLCFPLFWSYTITTDTELCDSSGKIISPNEDVNNTGHNVTTYVVAYVSDDHKTLCFWVYSVVIKLAPCILLTLLSVRLIIVLFETKKRRKTLMMPKVHLQTFREGKPIINRRIDKQADRTSGMLVAVLLLFLLTEFPQAILGLLSAVYGSVFEEECYIDLGE